MQYRIVIMSLMMLLCLCGCTARQETNGHSQDIVVDLSVRGDDFTTFANILNVDRVIPLESSPTCMIHDIKRIKFFKGEYYVLDVAGQRCILVFDGGGRFVRKIGRFGNGNGEYPSIEDFAINEDREEVAILSCNANVYQYSCKGDFLRKVDLGDFLVWNICWTGHGYLFSTNHYTFTEGEEARLVYEYDDDFSLKRKMMDVATDQIYTPTTIYSCLNRSKDGVAYSDQFTNSVFVIGDSGIVTYKYKLGDPMPQDIFSDTNAFMQNQSRYDYVLDNMVMDDGVLTFYMDGGTSCVAISDMAGDVRLNQPYAGMMPRLYDMVDGHILSAFSASEIIFGMEMMPMDKAIADSVDYSDNHFIVYMDINEDAVF